MDQPPNWIPNTGRPIGGPTVVLDLDGVISDATHRQHFLRGERSADKDWNGFFSSCVDDPVIPHGKALAESLSPALCLVILTARIHDIRQQTIDWLAANDVAHDWLILRGEREGDPSSDWKRAQLTGLIGAGAEIQLTVDDDPRNVEMMRNLGLASLYFPSGYYDDRDLGATEYR